MASNDVSEQEQSTTSNTISLNQLVDDTASDYASFIVTEPEKEVRTGVKLT